MNYCDEIKTMMELSKEKNEPVISTFNGETIFVKYYDLFDEFILQYSWVITEGDDEIEREVKASLNNRLVTEAEKNQISQKMDVIQIGLLSVYDTNVESFLKIIELSKQKQLGCSRDTKYIFAGKKILRIAQYHGTMFNPFECIDSISKWNQPNLKSEVENKKMTNMMRGVEHNYSSESGEITFSLGCGYKKTIFKESINETTPQFVFIDSLKDSKEQ